jgi:hypothetical protein
MRGEDDLGWSAAAWEDTRARRNSETTYTEINVILGDAARAQATGKDDTLNNPQE